MAISGPLSGKKGVLATVMGIKLTAAVLAAPNGGGVSAHSGHKVKQLLTDRWYQRVEDSGSYATWMTLTTDRHVPSGWEGTWGAPISNALNDYNDPESVAGTHTVYLQEVGQAEANDVHVAVRSEVIWLWGQRFETHDFLGVTYLLDEAFHWCGDPATAGQGYGDCDALHSRPNTWWYALVLIDDDSHSGDFATSWWRQATVAHELGHAIGLAHEPYDGSCPVPKSIMDYDCFFAGYSNHALAWDSCGINHKYYDPNWGYAGC